MAARVWTIGHSTREFTELLEMLRANEITCLLDVRSFPGSRRFPQWNRAAISGALPPDIGYRWMRALGGRRYTPVGTPSANGAWRVKAFRDYADYMQTPEFGAGLGELIEAAGRGRPAIMCSEAVPWRCHRRLITDALITSGVEVRHIMSLTTTTPATLNENARVTGGRLTYPPTASPPVSLVDAVREAVLALPRGTVASYGDIGARIGAGPRQVGRAMSLLDPAVPWWRVVHADGTPATCHGGRAPALLRAEGTPMRGRRVDMSLARGIPRP